MKTSDTLLARELGRIFKPAKPKYQVEQEKHEKRCYAKAKRLAKKLDVEIEIDHVYTNDFPPVVQKGYWLNFDDENAKCMVGEYFSSSWSEILSKLKYIEMSRHPDAKVDEHGNYYIPE
jgi:hypothetical protein